MAVSLDVGEGLLERWRRELRQIGDKAYIGQGQALPGEVMRLKRELAKVKQ